MVDLIILFDIHPTCSTEEHKCRVKYIRGPALIVSSALSNSPGAHVDTLSAAAISAH